MNHLEANLLELAKKQPEVSALLRSTDRSHIKVFPSAEGTPTAAVECDGKEITLHSRYNPAREARNELKKQDCAGADHFIFLGFGMGYLLEALIATYADPDYHYFVVEADAGMLRAAFEARDFAPLLAAHDITFAVARTGQELALQWRERFNLALARKSTYITHGPSLLRHNSYYKEAVESLQGQIFQAVGEYNTMVEKAPIFLQNFVQNFSKMSTAPGINIFAGRFAHTPAVIVSAGPSLDKNIQALRGQEDNLLLLSTDTALKPLLAAGVEPQFVLTGDPTHTNYLHLSGAVTSKTLLVMEATAYPQVSEGFPDRLLSCCFSNSILRGITNLLSDKGVLRVWGSVATMALDFALFLNCDPIIFIGQDLAYTGGRIYCSGTLYDVWFKYCKTPEDVEKCLTSYRAIQKAQVYEDIYGQPIETIPNLVAYRDWIIRTIQEHPEKHFINATEGGILRGPLELASLREVLERDCRQPLQLRARIAEIFAAAQATAPPDVRRLIAPLRKELEAVRQTTRRGARLAAEKPIADDLQRYLDKLERLSNAIYHEERMAILMDTFNQPGLATFKRRYHVLSKEMLQAEHISAIQKTYADYFASVQAALDVIDKALDDMYAGTLPSTP